MQNIRTTTNCANCRHSWNAYIPPDYPCDDEWEEVPASLCCGAPGHGQPPQGDLDEYEYEEVVRDWINGIVVSSALVCDLHEPRSAASDGRSVPDSPFS